MRILIALLLFAAPVHAEDIHADAFGIVPTAEVSDARAAWAGLKTGSQSYVTQPEAVENLLLFVGPKTLVAGRDDGHAVALVLDRHGNLARDGLPVELRLAEKVFSANVVDGIADVVFVPEPMSGTFVAGATASDRQSARALFRVTADLASVLPSVQPSFARTEETAHVRTTLLSDQFGNIVEDGVFLPLTLGHEDGSTTFAGGLSIGGQAEFDLLTRGLESGGSAQVAVACNQSEPTAFELVKVRAFGRPPVRIWAVDELEAIGLRVGPMSMMSGHLLVDGAEITARIASATGRAVVVSGWLRDGVFEEIVPLGPSDGPFDVRITSALGEQVEKVTPGEAPDPLRGAE